MGIKYHGINNEGNPNICAGEVYKRNLAINEKHEKYSSIAYGIQP